MARKPNAQRLYEELLDRYGREVADAFLAAIQDIRDAADLQRLIAAAASGDLNEAIDALHLDGAAFAELLEAIRRGYLEAGTLTAAGMRLQAVFRFDARNPQAEAWLREVSSQLVTRIMEDQREAVRQALAAGMQKGANPRTTALDIVGRLNRATGRREGGIVGLTTQQEQFARTAGEELRSGDPEQLRHYLTRQRRDKRFDRTVQKAIREEKPLPAEVVAKIERSYRNRLLQLRGEMIGRTESLTALRAAKHEAYRQAVEAGQVSEQSIRRTWRSAGDLRVRHTHMFLNGDTVGLNETFRSPSGARLMYPGDTAAPASETIGCRCDVSYRIDFLANL